MMGELHTSAIDLISSIHGHQRRVERNISVKDLQSAIKYGTKESQLRTLKDDTTVLRYKYTHADIVYITDATSTVEITSYVLPLPLDNVVSSDSHQYEAAKRRIRNDPYSITSHAVFVIDCSGSMKKSDVEAHRCRLDAVRYAVATDFIAERLHDPSIGISPLDVVTIIEMRDVATVVFEKEPISWILYNKLVDHSRESRPSSHGNYLPALEKAEEALVSGDHQNLALSLFFLSDGRPSDVYLSRHRSFTGITKVHLVIKATNIAQHFKSRLTFAMVGFGGPREDMSVLESMATHMSLEGSVGKFHRSNLKKLDTLSSCIATMASTLTSTRTLLTASRNDNSKERSFTQATFNKNVFSPGTTWSTNTIKNHYLCRHELVRYKKGFTWKQIPLADVSAIGISWNKDPFGKGAERLVYQLIEIGANKRRVGANLVAKNSKFEGNYDFRGYHYSFCKTQKIAANMASKFNQQLDRSIYVGDNVPRISFLDCYVYAFYEDNAIDELNLLVEKQIDHNQYTKWNDNAGGVKHGTNAPSMFEIAEEEEEDEEEEGTVVDKDHLFMEKQPTVDSEDEDEHHGYEVRKTHATPSTKVFDILDHEVPQAFTHFTYRWSNREKMVCDLQGVLNKTKNIFELTDPVIHYVSRTGRTHVHGRTDKGLKGINDFFKTHKCNKLCEAIGIASFKQ